jgi:hypothetical protein
MRCLSAPRSRGHIDSAARVSKRPAGGGMQIKFDATADSRGSYKEAVTLSAVVRIAVTLLQRSLGWNQTN